MKKNHYYLLILLFLGLLVRFFFVSNPGFEADVAYWKSWSLAAVDKGTMWTVTQTNYNYPPVFVYLLWILGKIYSLFTNPHDFNAFWQNTNILFLFLVKLIPIISDLIIAILLYFLGEKLTAKKVGPAPDVSGVNSLADLKNKSDLAKKSLPLLMAALYLFNPAVILDGSIWGQVDSFGVLIFMISLVFLFLKKPFWSSLVFTLAFLLKLQNIIYIPIFFLFILLRFGKKTFFKSLAVSITAFFLLCFEYFLHHQGAAIIKLMFQNADWFPYLSLNSYNLWWIVSGANGMGVSDKILTLGVVNAKTFGLILFSASYLWCLGLILKKSSFENLILSCLLAVFSFYLLLTQAHERYIFPAIIFLIMLLPYYHRHNSKMKGFWKIFFFSLTVTSFYNLHNAFIHFYPQNGLPLISSLNIKLLTMLFSLASITLFIGLLIFVFKKLHSLFPVLSLGLIVSSLIFLNSSYLFKRKVALTNLRPISEISTFAPCAKDMTVNANFGWKNWNRLSVNYFFYKKGFGCHAHSELGFDLNKKFKTFSTDFGIDTEAGVESSVIFKILTDQELVFTSEKMGRFDLPKHVEVDVQSVKTLTLIIENAGDGNKDDHGDWLRPMLYR